MGTQLTEHDVRARAYALWEARGRPEGTAQEDWDAAEQQLKLEAEREAGATPLEPLAADAADALEPDLLEPEPTTPPAPRARQDRKNRGDRVSQTPR